MNRTLGIAAALLFLLGAGSSLAFTNTSKPGGGADRGERRGQHQPLLPDSTQIERMLDELRATLDLSEEQRRVREAIAHLPQRQRQALILKQYQEMRYQEIAEAMETTVASVQMLLHRAMAALKKDLASRRQDYD